VARIPAVTGPRTVEDEPAFRAAGELPAILDLWMLNSPKLAELHAGTRRYLATSMPFAHSLRELSNVVIAVEMASAALLHRHGRTAIERSGARPEAVEAVKALHYESLTDEERLIAQYVREVVHGTVTDETFDALRDKIGNKGMVDFTFLITTNIAWVRYAQALGIESDDREGRLDAPFEALISGQPLYETSVAREGQ
jgi:alkylhydroperoxidase family enzyme